jgi:hypothetical protein
MTKIHEIEASEGGCGYCSGRSFLMRKAPTMFELISGLF